MAKIRYVEFKLAWDFLEIVSNGPSIDRSLHTSASVRIASIS